MDKTWTRMVPWRARGDIAHQDNMDVWEAARVVAEKNRFHLTVYTTSKGNHTGWMRYALYTGEGRPYGTRSSRVVIFTQAPYQHNFLPSHIGERRALEELVRQLDARGSGDHATTA